ncbi:beta-galactosidase [bacterium]|nr:beta-galactosidase [bacterium]
MKLTGSPKTGACCCILFILGSLVHHGTLSAGLYKINLTSPEKPVRTGHLQMGGENSQGDLITVNSFYLSMDGKPVIPVTGEFHYARYPGQYWDESIRKLKAGGVNIIATYVFWNIHEETEGVFDWKGDKNLRKFIELCDKNNLRVIVRVGPFCHGEIRNGGLPDWLLGRPVIVRSNDPGYLRYVERFYGEIFRQIKGLLFKDGGPVIAVQLENEFQHSWAPWGLTYPGQPYDGTYAERDREYTAAGAGSAEKINPYAGLGIEHMKILKALAEKTGIDVPVYTATGWGYAAIIENETLPVTAAYAYPTWSSQKFSPFYIYTELQKNPDYAPVRYDAEDYPCFAAEISGGIMVRYNRRPVVPPKSLDALINRFIGSGANGIGYYMVHGGSTPKGENGFFSDEAYGYPKISYDFQAPVGEFGQIKESFHRLKLLHYFLNDFGDLLAPMGVVLPGQSNRNPKNTDTLRYAVRKSGDSGFIFMLNFQDHLRTRDIQDIQFQLETRHGLMHIPEASSFTLKREENAILPFNFDMSGFHLNYASAQLLTKLENENDHMTVFFAIDGIEPELSIRTGPDITFETINCQVHESGDHVVARFSADLPGQLTINEQVKVLVVPRETALHAWKAVIDGNEHLIFSDAVVLQNNGQFEAVSRGKPLIAFDIYPELSGEATTDAGTITKSPADEAIFSHFEISLPKIEIEPGIKKITENKYCLSLPEKDKHLNDLFLNIDYTGDTGMLFLNGELVADHFYFGKTWDIGLKRFWDGSSGNEMVLYFRPLTKDAPFFQDFAPESVPDFQESRKYFKLNHIRFVPEYKVRFQFN